MMFICFLSLSFVHRKKYEAKLKAQIKEAEANALNCQAKVNDLSYKISELERDLTNKTWNIERKCLHHKLLCPFEVHSRIRHKSI